MGWNFGKKVFLEPVLSARFEQGGAREPAGRQRDDDENKNGRDQHFSGNDDVRHAA